MQAPARAPVDSLGSGWGILVHSMMAHFVQVWTVKEQRASASQLHDSSGQFLMQPAFWRANSRVPGTASVNTTATPKHSAG